MNDGLNFAAWLGKEAAYRRSYLLPPKKVTSHSRTIKLRTSKDKKESEKTMKSSAGNVQPPHRYGRKTRKR